MRIWWKFGYHFENDNDKAYSSLGSIFGSPNFGKLRHTQARHSFRLATDFFPGRKAWKGTGIEGVWGLALQIVLHWALKSANISCITSRLFGPLGLGV